MPLERGNGGNSTLQARRKHYPELNSEMPAVENLRIKRSMWLCCWSDSRPEFHERCLCRRFPCACATQEERESSMPEASGDSLCMEEASHLSEECSIALPSHGTALQDICKNPVALISDVVSGTNEEQANPQPTCNSGSEDVAQGRASSLTRMGSFAALVHPDALQQINNNPSNTEQPLSSAPKGPTVKAGPDAAHPNVPAPLPTGPYAAHPNVTATLPAGPDAAHLNVPATLPAGPDAAHLNVPASLPAPALRASATSSLRSSCVSLPKSMADDASCLDADKVASQSLDSSDPEQEERGGAPRSTSLPAPARPGPLDVGGRRSGAASPTMSLSSLSGSSSPVGGRRPTTPSVSMSFSPLYEGNEDGTTATNSPRSVDGLPATDRSAREFRVKDVPLRVEESAEEAEDGDWAPKEAPADQVDPLPTRPPNADTSHSKPPPHSKAPKAELARAASERAEGVVWAPGESTAAVEAAREQLKQQMASSKTRASFAANNAEAGTHNNSDLLAMNPFTRRLEKHRQKARAASAAAAALVEEVEVNGSTGEEVTRYEVKDTDQLGFVSCKQLKSLLFAWSLEGGAGNRQALATSAAVVKDMFVAADARRTHWRIMDAKKESEDWRQWELKKSEFEQQARQKAEEARSRRKQMIAQLEDQRKALQEQLSMARQLEELNRWQPSRQAETQGSRYRTIHDVIQEGNIAAPTYSNVNERRKISVRSGGTSPGEARHSPEMGLMSGASTPPLDFEMPLTPDATPIATHGTTPPSGKLAAYDSSDELWVQTAHMGTGSDGSPGLLRVAEAIESGGNGDHPAVPDSMAPARSSWKASERSDKLGSGVADSGRPPVSRLRRAMWAK